VLGNVEYMGDVRLSGYFQSEKYFLKHNDKVRELFKYPSEVLLSVINKYGDLLNKKTCSITY
jgi:hypothetical protein